MMRKILSIMVTLALCGGVAFSQGITDAYKFSQSDLNGTARYLGMGGAFGALGGDISAMKSNPAGLAVYRSSEVVTTMSMNMVSAKTNWLGVNTTKDKRYGSFDNIAYVGYFPTGNDEGVLSWNVGFAYNRVKNFRRNYTMSSGNALHTSVSDYIASRAFGTPISDLTKTDNYNPYDWDGTGDSPDWLSALGVNSGMINAYNDNPNDYYSVFGDKNMDPADPDRWVPYGIDDAILSVSESGAIDQYDISFGMNISDRVLLGATIAVTDINYIYESHYDEFFQFEKNDLHLDNVLSTDGTGYAFNIGAIVRPADFLRLGVAYNSPTWYKMTDYYYGEAGSSVTYMDNGKLVQAAGADNTPGNAASDYELRTPDKWILSAAAIIGQSALLSVDYELTNYKNMRLSNANGSDNSFMNDRIKMGYGMGNTLRIGAEVKVTPQFAVRAGGAWSSTPLKTDLKNNNQEVFTVGTIPNYTLDKGSSNYTVGLGYRFTPNFYTDLACVFTTYKDDVYAFSNIIDDAGQNVIEAQPATMKTKSTRVALTLGYKF